MGKTNMLVLPLCSYVSWHEGCLINFTPQTFLKYEAQLANRPKVKPPTWILSAIEIILTLCFIY